MQHTCLGAQTLNAIFQLLERQNGESVPAINATTENKKPRPI
jgi:hypothetical protein